MQILYEGGILEYLRRGSVLAGGAGRLEIGEPEGLRVIRIFGLRAVAIFDQRALALGVVVDIGDESRACRCAAQIDIDLFQ